eukprot:15067493-Ditylum_brightwellii.AAC.1
MPVDAPPDYVTAVQRLRAVLLNECAPAQTQQPSQPQPMKKAPQRSPNQAMTAKTPSVVPTNRPALIPCEDDEIDQPTPMEDCVQPTLAPRQCNLRERATHIINLVIIEETPNVTSTTSPPKHIGKYTEAMKHLLITGTFKTELHLPNGMFAGAVINPDTGKMLEYRDLIKHKKYKE